MAAGLPRPAQDGRRLRARDRHDRPRYLGGRLRPGRPRRRAARQSLSLSRRPDAGDVRAGVCPDAARRNLRRHRHPVHGDQHAVSTARLAREQLAAVGRGRVAADDSRLVQLAADRRQGERADRRHHLAVLRSAQADLGLRDARAARHPDQDFRPAGPAGRNRRPVAAEPGRRAGPDQCQGRAPRHARYGQRGGLGAGRGRRAGAADVVLHQLGHVVADGRRDSRPDPRRALPGPQLHQRRGRRRHDPAAQEHRRACGWCRNAAASGTSAEPTTIGKT